MKCFGVVPACGRSRRMGQPKLLLPYGDSTLIEHVLSVWRASRVEHVIVVVRADDGPLQAAVGRAGAELVIPDRPPADMKASVRAALTHIATSYQPAAADAWMLAPADLPGLQPALINRVMAGHTPQNRSILVPVCGGRRGHPVLFPWSLSHELDGLEDGQGVRVLLEHHPVRDIPWDDEAAFRDLDTPEDYRGLA